jgi:2'-5' RNA ligase
MLERQEPRPDETFGHRALTQHWSWRPEWTPERRSWWWYGTFEHDTAVRRLAGRARTVLRPGAPVDVVPTPWLHLTLAEIGYAADFPRHLAYETARTAQANLTDLAPVELHVGPVTAMPGAVVLRVRGSGLRELHELLVSALPDAIPRKPVQRAFDPHVSVAYIGRDCTSREVLAANRREELQGTTRLDHVSLVEVVRDKRHYRWTPRCRISLGGRRPRHLRALD